MNAYKVVHDFEAALAEYTGAPFVVSTNSCSSALLIVLDWFSPVTITFPRRTYCSAALAAIHAGHKVEFAPIDWHGDYRLDPLPVWDSARRFTSGMFREGQIQTISFQTSKILGLEQGGAILTDNGELATFLRRQRFDGRLDASEKLPMQLGRHCYMNPSTAALGLQHLACLPRDNPDQAGASDFPDISELPFFRL